MGSYADYYGIKLPIIGQVAENIQYGWDGTEFTGTLLVGAAPNAGDLRFGTIVGSTTGTLRVPTADQTLLGVLVDNTTGTVRQALTSKVELGYVYGPSDSLTGTVRIPGASKVEANYVYGPSDSLTGTLLATGGSGTSYQIVVKDSTNKPIANCSCWVANDSAGTSVVTPVYETDSQGSVDFVLESGTYWLFRQKNGVAFTNNPKEFTVA